jgi:glucose-1-phosphate cytidylyltransferase
MKVVILAGGKGTRLAEETVLKPKPMVEIGGRPILWHIMMHYWHYGHKEFVIALGYKGGHIKKYMVDYCALGGDLSVNFKQGTWEGCGAQQAPDWRVDLIDTGQETLTGGRIKRLEPYVNSQTFMLTWGDGVSDINLNKLIAFHKSHGKLATVTAVRPTARYGHLEFEGNYVCEFSEKPQTSEGWINGAFFVLEPGVFDYIDGDMTMWEQEPMRHLAEDRQLVAFKHEGFWQCMDTLREKHILEEIWTSGNAPWKSWEVNEYESVSNW